MDEREVVTCFLRNEGRVLLARRSDDAGSYPGQWGAITGYLTPERGAPPDDPETAARREIREETGLEDVALVRQGEPFAVEDADRGTRWRVHPFLFETETRGIDPNWELPEYEWIHATAIRRRETVPDLWRSYDRVRPTVGTVAADDEHGSAWISLLALEVLRDEAALAADFETVAAVARELLAARPSMAVVETRINRVMSAAGVAPGDVEAAAREEIASAVEADRVAAAVAADRIEGARVCTLSRSGTVQTALERADPDAVLIAESRPGGEGIDVAESLAGDFEVTLTSDAALAGRLAEFDADAVVVGADTILPDGRVLNKVGTHGLALAAAAHDLPCYAVAAADKITPDTEVDVEQAPTTLYEGDADVVVANPLFETTPPDRWTGICTDEGMLDADDVSDIAARHRSHRQW